MTTLIQPPVVPPLFPTVRIGLVALLLPAFAVAQSCDGAAGDVCTYPHAVCSPATMGSGPTGHCQTFGAKGNFRCECVGATLLDMSGRWSANDGGVYYVRQIGNDIWWAGMSVETPLGYADLHKGLRFTNVFHGQLSGPVVIGGPDVTLTGDWAGVPRGPSLGAGSLTINVSLTNPDAQMSIVTATGDFSATAWNRAPVDPPPPPLLTELGAFFPYLDIGDIFSIFNLVKKNQNSWYDHSLLDNLKPAKSKPVVVFGNVISNPAGCSTPPGLDVTVGYWPQTGTPHIDRTYHDFICFNGGNKPDGDIDFNIVVDRDRLDAQIGFWSQGWETGHNVSATDFRFKLDACNRPPQLHIESIMYGGISECGVPTVVAVPSGSYEILLPLSDQNDPGLTLLPGWQQGGANGVLLNGVPIAGNMNFSWMSQLNTSEVTTIGGRTVKHGDRVRITGILVLDCGHASGGDPRPCDEDKPASQNQEIHPVYALDFVQDFQKPRPLPTLTGVWSADDAGTYYVRQVGNTVWWLGLSPDESYAYSNQPQTFANVFQGTIQNGQVIGNWADIPLGATNGAGPMQLNLTGGSDVAGGPESTGMMRFGDGGTFSGSSWEKLYDVAAKDIIVGFESITAEGAMPETSEPFEFTVGGRRIATQPQKAESVSTGAKRSIRAKIGTRIPVTVSGSSPLSISVTFAGYRATWTIPADSKPGVYTRTLTPPRALPSDGPEPPPNAAKPAARALAPLTITYRIENAGPPR
jgi:hypothetical protein